ncbi:Ig-like domain-containing protein [Konateibacter massiliensis]|uniref:Ig-like domain-containing protein n=1 Tax=Konateibacter massiliensis TaxID=2002841 RepID=UPI000C14B603|nr:Ig-like domain-containing protein [Konateibacter massiliensis]
MKKKLSGIMIKRVATCALAAAIAATSAPSQIAFASSVNVEEESTEAVTLEQPSVSNDATATYGSEGLQFEEGTYTVPVTLMQAANPSKASMAAGCIEETGILTILADGTATLQTKWKTLSYLGLQANLTALGVYPSTDYNDNDNMVYGTVDTYREYNGSEVPEKITVTIPEQMKDQNGFYAWTETDLSGMNNPVFLSVDYANAVKEGTTEDDTEDGGVEDGSTEDGSTEDGSTEDDSTDDSETSIDKDSLNESITNAQAIVKDYNYYTYSDDSFSQLQDAIAAAAVVYANEDATQEEIDAQVTALSDAIAALEIVVAEGYYAVDAEFWHATNAAVSSADKALTGAYLDVDANGVATVYLNFIPLGKIWVDDVNYPTEGGYTDATITKTDADGNPTQWSFVLPQTSEYTTIQVGYDTGTSYGRMTHNVRLKIEYDSLIQAYHVSEGYYSADAKFWHATNNAASSANSYLLGTYMDVDAQENVTVYMNLKVGTAYVSNIKYMAASGYTDATVTKTDETTGRPTQWSFVLPKNTEYTGLQFSVNTGTVMGIMTNEARLKINYDSLSAINLNFGPDAVKLMPGKYFVSVDLMNASNLTAQSMASLALEKVGLLTVAEDGTATIQTKWKSLQFGALEGNLTELGVFPSTSTSDTEGLTYATIDSYRDFEATQVPEKFSFQIPDAMKGSAGVYVYTKTDIGHNNAAYLKINYDSVETANVNRTNLEAVITQAKELVATQGVYTASSLSNLSGAISAAEEIYNSEFVLQTSLDSQASTLNTLISGLVKQADKTSLNSIITKAKAIAKGTYTDSSYSGLTAAITAALAVYNNGEATEAQVSAQITALTNAINALKTSSISLNQTAATLYTSIGAATTQLSATVSGDSQTVTWSSSNTSIATVSSTGLVTAKATGTATITATANGVKATCLVTVKAPSLTLKSASGTVVVGSKITIEATADPTGKITYATSNKKVATVTSAGVVKGIKTGTAKITVTANGVSKTYKVTVKKQTLTLKKSSGTVTAGKTIEIKATASPNGTITYKTSNKKVATVTSDGVVKGIKAGTATITVKCNGVSKTYKVTVKKQTLTLKASSAAVKVGKTVSIKATASPKETITYKSSNENVATVTSKGVVKGIAKGTAKITVTSNGVSKTFKVTVK